MNEKGELYDAKRLISFLTIASEMTLQDLTKTLMNDVRSFTEAAEQSDDITILCLDFRG